MVKKFVTSFAFVFVFASYGLLQYFGSPVSISINFGPSNKTPVTEPTSIATLPQSVPPPAQASLPKKTVATAPAKTPSALTPKPNPISTPIPTPIFVPTPVPTPKGQYVDGTYIGSVADAYYGNIQVQAVISGGKLTDVIFLQYPNDRGHSVSINNYAMPILKSEAIQAQSAQVNSVSGASDTSAAFQESLASALSQAKS